MIVEIQPLGKLFVATDFEAIQKLPLNDAVKVQLMTVLMVDQKPEFYTLS